MKKSFILVLLALLLIPIISAVQIDMKSNFSQDETLITQVSGNFLEKIQVQNIFLYKGHVRVSFIPYVKEMGDKFYIYGQLFGKSEGNYSLIIRNVDYFESGEVKDDDITKNFTITNNSADFSISPGFLQAAGEFSISAQNLIDTTLTVTSFIKNSTETEVETGFFSSLFGGSSASEKKTETQISPGQTKAIPFSVDNSYNNQLIYFVLETGNTYYEVPVFVLGSVIENESNPVFGFQPNQRDVFLATSSHTFIYLYLYNSGQENLTDISLFVSDTIKPYVFIQNQTLLLDANSSAQIRANISSGILDGIFEGQITASSENLTSDFILILNFSKSYVPANGTKLFQTCAELSGQFCNENQICEGSIKNAVDSSADKVCCVGSCKAIPTNSGKIFGWMLVAIIVLLVIAFFVQRYVKAKKPFNLLDFARKK